MRDADVTKIKEIQAGIRAMLAERASLIQPTAERTNGNSAQVIAPSSYWSDFCAQFEYMLELAPREFAKLRNHTYHLTSDNYQTYYFGDPVMFRRLSCYDAVIAGLPPRYLVGEPEDGIGYQLDGRRVSWDIIRFQRAISALYRQRVFDQLPTSRRLHVLEIGGGYGGMAHQLGKILDNASYVIVDLPETLVFSASYLSLHNPDKKIYLYSKDTFQQALRELDSFDFVLLPNFVLKQLLPVAFDLVINIASLQEMRRAQAEEYLDFIKKSGAVFYSDNQDHQPRNAELGTLYDLLVPRFRLTEIPEETDEPERTPVRRLQRFAEDVIRKVANRPRAHNLPTRRIICRPSA
jgi:hypothetical protein